MPRPRKRAEPFAAGNATTWSPSPEAASAGAWLDLDIRYWDAYTEEFALFMLISLAVGGILLIPRFGLPLAAGLVILLAWGYGLLVREEGRLVASSHGKYPVHHRPGHSQT